MKLIHQMKKQRVLVITEAFFDQNSYSGNFYDSFQHKCQQLGLVIENDRLDHSGKHNFLRGYVTAEELKTLLEPTKYDDYTKGNVLCIKFISGFEWRAADDGEYLNASGLQLRLRHSISGVDQGVTLELLIDKHGWRMIRQAGARSHDYARIAYENLRRAAEVLVQAAKGSRPAGVFEENDSTDPCDEIVAHSGFDAEGYDSHGYNQQGRNREGLDREGYDPEGFDVRGYDRRGKDREGYDRDGFNAQGVDRSGLNKEGEKVE